MEKEEIKRELQRHQFDLKTLRKKSKPIEEIDDEVKQLAKDLILALKLSNGWGIAAPQLGINVKMIAYRAFPGKIEILINPVIVATKGTQFVEEGCLSFPHIYAKVRRPKEVKVKALNLKGEKVFIKGTGALARLLAHEIEHLYGIVYLEKNGKKVTFDKYDFLRLLYYPTKTQLNNGDKNVNRDVER